MMTQEEYIKQGLDDNAPLKLILCGNTEISGSEKVGVVSVVYATNDRARAEAQLRSLMEEHLERYYMVYGVPMDEDLTGLPHYPSIAITRDDLR